jgi:hypothetical protein
LKYACEPFPPAALPTDFSLDFATKSVLKPVLAGRGVGAGQDLIEHCVQVAQWMAKPDDLTLGVYDERGGNASLPEGSHIAFANIAGGVDRYRIIHFVALVHDEGFDDTRLLARYPHEDDAIFVLLL